MKQPPPTPRFADVEPIIVRLLADSVLTARAVDEGAYSPSGRWVVTLADGRTAFVKAELQPSDVFGTAVEHLVASSVDATWIPRTLGYDPGDGVRPRVLITEDLSSAHWGIPVTETDARSLSDAIEEMRATRAPEDLRPAAFGSTWTDLDLDRLSATGLAPRAWLDAHIDALAAAAVGADESGSSLVHADAWRQNWCILDGRAVFVDWSSARRGNTMITRAWAEAAVRAAGGPPGLLLRGDPAWAAWMAGRTCEFLIDDEWPRHPRLDETERREAHAALAWVSEELDIEPPVPEAGAMPLGPWRP